MSSYQLQFSWKSFEDNFVLREDRGFGSHYVNSQWVELTAIVYDRNNNACDWGYNLQRNMDPLQRIVISLSYSLGADLCLRRSVRIVDSALCWNLGYINRNLWKKFLSCETCGINNVKKSLENLDLPPIDFVNTDSWQFPGSTKEIPFGKNLCSQEKCY